MVFQQKLLEKACFIVKMTASAMVWPASSDFWKAPLVRENKGLFTGKNNGFPFLEILGNLKNTHKNPKFGRVRQVPTRELGWEFPG